MSYFRLEVANIKLVTSHAIWLIFTFVYKNFILHPIIFLTWFFKMKHPQYLIQFKTVLSKILMDLILYSVKYILDHFTLG